MSCTFWLRRKKAKATHQKELVKAETAKEIAVANVKTTKEAVKQETVKAPAKKGGAKKNDTTTD